MRRRIKYLIVGRLGVSRDGDLEREESDKSGCLIEIERIVVGAIQLLLMRGI